MRIENSSSVMQSKPFHTIEEALDIEAGELVGMSEDGETLGVYDAAGETSIPYGLCIESIDGSCLIVDQGWVFNDWGLTIAEKRLLKTAGVIVQ